MICCANLFIGFEDVTEIEKTCWATKNTISNNHYTFFFLISNLVAKTPGLNLGKTLSNLLSKHEA